MSTSTGDNKSLAEKALNTTKYIGKNFWKVLPVGSAINYEHNKEDKFLIETCFHSVYAGLGVVILTLYLGSGIFEGNWTPKKIKEDFKKSKIEQEGKVQYKSELEKNVR